MYEEIRAELEDQRQKLETRLNKISTGHLANGAVNADSQEQATENANDEVYDGLEANAIEHLEAIKAALARMTEGAYGICVDCDEKIPVARLKALPFAVRCVACESARE